MDIIARVPEGEFYETYHGHPVEYLKRIHCHCRSIKPRGHFVFLAGDSSLDNKFWFDEYQPAISGYESILDPPRMKPDIAYHINQCLADRGHGSTITAINGSVEESTLRQRDRGESLLEQDLFIRDHLGRNDTLIVSVGGNDIAFSPSAATIFNILKLVYFNSEKELTEEFRSCYGAPYFIEMFRDEIQQYIEALVSKTKPEQVIVCMIYFPDEEPTGGWASFALGALGYNSNPRKLQRIIQGIFEEAVSHIRVPGTRVIPFPMYKVLHGKDTSDYVERVEPSVQGGQKLAEEFCEYLTPKVVFR